ncbi:hypothetical protein C8Q78DRAFT_987974 [Trametes maxima]|nr:hypothetical protein C8Q78DRAFT_987974 [Trametes maxima]
MGQDWDFFNIDKKQLAVDIGYKLMAYYFFENGWAHERFVDSLRTQHLPQAYDDLLTQGRPAAKQHGRLGKLPVELLGMIFDELPSNDALRFAVTCKLLLAAGKQRLTQTLSDRYPSWRGDRILLLGDWFNTREDLPAGLFTDAEWNEGVQIALENIEPEGREAALAEGISMHSFAWISYEKGSFSDSPFRPYNGNRPCDLTWEIWENLGPRPGRDRGLTIDEDDESTLIPWAIGKADIRNLNALWKVRYETGGVEVACNLSKGEYIRADGFTVPPAVSLGQALLTRIAWSTGGNAAICGDHEFLDELTKGTWAGDRLAVTTIDALPALGPEVGGGQWRDMTEEVDRLLWHLWTKNYVEPELPDVEEADPEEADSEEAGTEKAGSEEADSEEVMP